MSEVYSPQELLVHWQCHFKKHCRVLPGSYCEVHDKPLPSDTKVVPTHEAIVAGPTGNLQGSVKLFCLKTG